MGKTVKNKETKVIKNCYLNDCDILNDILISYKHLVSSYAIALNEASNKNIYDLYFKNFEIISSRQAKLFQFSFKNGWYKLETADKSKIDEAYKKFNKMLPELTCECEENK